MQASIIHRPKGLVAGCHKPRPGDPRSSRGRRPTRHTETRSAPREPRHRRAPRPDWLREGRGRPASLGGLLPPGAAGDVITQRRTSHRDARLGPVPPRHGRSCRYVPGPRVPRPAGLGPARPGSGGGAAQGRRGAVREPGSARRRLTLRAGPGGAARLPLPITPRPLCQQVLVRPAAREPPAARCAAAPSPSPSRGARDPHRPPHDGTCGEGRGAAAAGWAESESGERNAGGRGFRWGREGELRWLRREDGRIGGNLAALCGSPKGGCGELGLGFCCG